MINEIINSIKDKTITYSQISPNRHLIEVNYVNLPEVIRKLVIDFKIHFSTCLGVDSRALNNMYELYYILTCKDNVIIVKSKIPYSILKSYSCTKYIPACNWCEREIKDLLGIEFLEHPDTRKLILPDNWPSNVNPLRKEFYYSNRIPEVEEPYKIKELKDVQIIKVNAHHPCFYEPEDVIVYVKNNEIIDVDYRGFHIHRGIEKLGESRLRIDQISFLAERICGICGFTHSCAYCQAIENALKIEVPEKALYIRSLLLELERIESHLIWLALMCYILGKLNYVIEILKVRESVMNICEIITGNRKMYGMNLVGGVRKDITSDELEELKKFLKYNKPEIENVLKKIENDSEISKKTENIGKLSFENAHVVGVVGPVARASGINYDVRKYLPYAAYKHLNFKIPVKTSGDVKARIDIRIKETYESLYIVEQIVDKLPKGDIICTEFEFIENAIGVGITEAPRGENVHFVITGSDFKVFRWKVRAPTYANLPSLPYILIGYRVEYAPMIIASLDPCFSCTDRITIIDLNENKKEYVSIWKLCKKLWR